MPEPVSTSALLMTLARVGIPAVRSLLAGNQRDKFKRESEKEQNLNNLIRALSKGRIQPQSTVAPPKEGTLSKLLGAAQMGIGAYDQFKNLQHQNRMRGAQTSAAEHEAGVLRGAGLAAQQTLSQGQRVDPPANALVLPETIVTAKREPMSNAEALGFQQFKSQDFQRQFGNQISAATLLGNISKHGKLTPKEIITTENSLRDDFKSETKLFLTRQTAFNTIRAVAQRGTAASDIALIFSFMRLNDPDSTVRESEYATAANARGVPEHIRGTWNRLKKGERLTDNQRADFVATAGSIYESQVPLFQGTLELYTNRSHRSGVDFRNVVQDYTQFTQGLDVDTEAALETGSGDQPGNSQSVLDLEGRDSITNAARAGNEEDVGIVSDPVARLNRLLRQKEFPSFGESFNNPRINRALERAGRLTRE